LLEDNVVVIDDHPEEELLSKLLQEISILKLIHRNQPLSRVLGSLGRSKDLEDMLVFLSEPLKACPSKEPLSA
jgi:hypothetical protein